MMRLLIAFLILTSTLGATDVRFPMRGAVVTPEPVPEMVAEVVDKIRADDWFIVESEKELICVTSPPGILEVEVCSGPMAFRGKFAGGEGKVETRKFTGPYLYAVTATVAGKAELIVVPVGVSSADQVQRVMLTVEGPRPPPDPEPDVDPDVDPVDPPAPTPAKLQIVIIHDPAKNADLPGSQIAAMDGQEVRQYAKTHCKMTGDTPDFRKLSVRQGVLSQPEWIKEAFNRPAPVLPAIVILTPTQTISGPLPQTVEETMALLRKYGGD